MHIKPEQGRLTASRKSNQNELIDLKEKLAKANLEIEKLTIKLNKFRKVTKLMEN